MVRTKNKPLTKPSHHKNEQDNISQPTVDTSGASSQQSSLDRSEVSSQNSSLDRSGASSPRKSNRPSEMKKGIKGISKRKSIPQRKSVVIQHKSYYMMRAFGTTEPISKKIYHEIKHLQSTTHNLIPKLPFSRLVREIIQKYDSQKNMRIQTSALQALQEAAEIHLVDLFAACNVVASHAKRKTIQRNDILVSRLLMNWHK